MHTMGQSCAVVNTLMVNVAGSVRCCEFPQWLNNRCLLKRDSPICYGGMKNVEKIWPNRKNTPEFCLEVLMKIAEKFSQCSRCRVRDLNQAPSEYEGSALLLHHLVRFTFPSSPLPNDVLPGGTNWKFKVYLIRWLVEPVKVHACFCSMLTVQTGELTFRENYRCKAARVRVSDKCVARSETF
jgi:hypothetical protein